jgi:hypothetical protein
METEKGKISKAQKIEDNKGSCEIEINLRGVRLAPSLYRFT